ncbi:12906_t:CDS:2, partial [Racocetra persica]
ITRSIKLEAFCTIILQYVDQNRVQLGAQITFKALYLTKKEMSNYWEIKTR